MSTDLSEELALLRSLDVREEVATQESVARAAARSPPQPQQPTEETPDVVPNDGSTSGKEAQQAEALQTAGSEQKMYSPCNEDIKETDHSIASTSENKEVQLATDTERHIDNAAPVSEKAIVREKDTSLSADEEVPIKQTPTTQVLAKEHPHVEFVAFVTPQQQPLLNGTVLSPGSSYNSILRKPMSPKASAESREQEEQPSNPANVAELRRRVAELQSQLQLTLKVAPAPSLAGTTGTVSPLRPPVASPHRSGATPATHRKGAPPPRTLTPLFHSAPMPISSSSAELPKDFVLSLPSVASSQPFPSGLSPSSTSTSKQHGTSLQKGHSNPRRLKDGLALMSTEARQEDFSTLVAKRELRLVTALEERKALEKKVQNLCTDVGPLEEQRNALVSMRQEYHTQMRELRAEEKALHQEILTLQWDETKLHGKVTTVTKKLQSFRHKRSEAEMKVLAEFNQVSFELIGLQKELKEEEEGYDKEFRESRAELRFLQESIVAFDPQEFVAATVASGRQTKSLVTEFGGNTRQAEKFLSPTLGAADRRRTVMELEKERKMLDAFLKGGNDE